MHFEWELVLDHVRNGTWQMLQTTIRRRSLPFLAFAVGLGAARFVDPAAVVGDAGGCGVGGGRGAGGTGVVGFAGIIGTGGMGVIGAGSMGDALRSVGVVVVSIPKGLTPM